MTTFFKEERSLNMQVTTRELPNDEGKERLPHLWVSKYFTTCECYSYIQTAKVLPVTARPALQLHVI
jgi:hypothetical protein